MVTLNAEQDNYLRGIYFNPSHPVSFQSAYKLYKFIKEDGKYQFTLKTLQDWLSDHENFSLNKNVLRNFQRGRVLVKGIDDQWDADLFSLIPYADANDGYSYVLAVIDIFSRFAWLVPLKKKTATETKNGFLSILQQGRKPQRLRTDMGSEFKSSVFGTAMKQEKINHFFTHNEKQANYVERFIQTIKKKLFRFLAAKKTRRYIDNLNDLVDSYNKTFHSGIQAIPREVNKENEAKLWWQMYWPEEGPGKKRKKRNVTKYFAFEKGDTVRMSLTKTAFDREYSVKWTIELFIISDRFPRQGKLMYKLKDWMGEEIEGTFYQAELQKTREPPVFTFSHIVKINGKIKARGQGARREVLVKWKGWPDKFNSWILASEARRLEKQ